MDSTETGAGQPRPRHRMIDRVAKILESIARSQHGMTLTEVAAQLEAPLSSTQGLLNGLVATGFVDERDKLYRFGTATYLLNSIAGRPAYANVSHSDLESVHAQTGMSTLLAITVGMDVYFADNATTDDEKYAYLARSYVRRSLIRTSAGAIFLADMPRREVWTYFQSLDESDSERIDRYFQLYPEIRRTGICAAPGLAKDGDGISIGVRERGRIVAAVSVVGTVDEVAARKDEIVELLTSYAPRWSDSDR